LVWNPIINGNIVVHYIYVLDNISYSVTVVQGEVKVYLSLNMGNIMKVDDIRRVLWHPV
jgi:hypothetical protein